MAGQRSARTATKTGNTWLATSTTPVNRQSFAGLDSLGRPIMTRVTGLDSVTLRYDGEGRLDRVQNGGRIDTYTYDPQGRLKTTTDPLGRTDSLFYDLADRVTRTRLWDGRQVQFGYDSSGNLTSLTPPGRPAHAFTYRPDDLAQSYAPPSLGSGTWATSYGYNLDGQLTAVARPTGDSVVLSYDPTNGRPTGVSFSRGSLGTGSLTYGYSATTGNLTSITHSAGSSLAFAYDGMLPMSVTWSGPVAGTVALGYDASFRVDTIQVNGSPIAVGYDNDGLLKTAGALKLGRRTDNGLLQADTLGVVTGSWTFDGRAALASYTAKVSGANVYQASYVRDSLGRVTSATETVQGTTLTRGFTYDSAGRVRDVTEGGVLVRTYGYDPNGNRTSRVIAVRSKASAPSVTRQKVRISRAVMCALAWIPARCAKRSRCSARARSTRSRIASLGSPPPWSAEEPLLNHHTLPTDCRSEDCRCWRWRRGTRLRRVPLSAWCVNR